MAGGLWANMSIGNSLGGAPYLAIRSAVRRMVNVGIVGVAAAGNDAGGMAVPAWGVGVGVAEWLMSASSSWRPPEMMREIWRDRMEFLEMGMTKSRPLMLRRWR